MKRLDIISNKIKATSTNYFGRGHFEVIIKDNSKLIIKWLEDLISVQEQIKNLEELGFEGIQKRNYVRILTKLFPNEYNHFIAMNIILRDIDSISAVFKGIHDTRKQYDTLLNHSRLKFPGKHNKFVDFHTYQQFVSFYKDDLINRALNFDIDEAIKIEPNQRYIYNVHSTSNKKVEVEKIDESETIEQPNVIEIKEPEETKLEEHFEEESSSKADEDTLQETAIETEAEKSETKQEEIAKKEKKQSGKKSKKEKTNWVQVLLKGI